MAIVKARHLRCEGLHPHCYSWADAGYGLQSLRNRCGGFELLDLCRLPITSAIALTNLLEHRDALFAHQSGQIAAGRLPDRADAADVLDAPKG